MKGVAGPLAALDGKALPLAQEGADGEESPAREDFDALLALVNAQAPNASAPVKVLAPSVGVQCVSVVAGKDGQLNGAPAAKSAAQAPLDVAPTQLFLPWRGAQVVPVAPAAVDDQVAPDTAPAAASVEPAPAAEAASGALPSTANAPAPVLSPSRETPALELTVQGTSKGAPPQRKSGARTHDERTEQSALGGSPSPTGPSPLAPQLAVPAASAPAPQPAAPSSNVTPSLSAPADRRAPVGIAAAPLPLASEEQEPVDPAAFAQLLADQPAADGASPVDLPVNTLGLSHAGTTPEAPRTAAPLERAAAPATTLPLADPDTQARVTKIEFFSSGETLAANEAPPSEAQPLEHMLEADQPESAPAENHEQSASGEQATADPRAPNDQPVADASKPSAAGARFEVTEGKGMRGLDAVVASLLRPYAEKPEGAGGGVRVPTSRVSHISVETGKSQNAKVEERVANVSQALDAAALRRQEEERRGELRELTEPAPLHLTQQPEPQADVPAETPSAQASAPVNVPAAPQPDPDAALMGKIARGESLNAAVSIEHPELGSMDVLVQNENGRIDVRATLETPRAAAVLRAHESALRYGVQQAGMTFGALRVSARTGEAKVEKSRDVPKRRRDRDWEA